MKDWAPGAGPDRVLVIVPAYNEEAVIGATLAGLREELPGADVLVVDDGSVDATADVARAAGFPVARLACNLGVGAALRTGFVYASRNGYGRAVQFDADGQHNAAEVKVLLEALDADIDLVIGSRFATSETVFEVGRIRSGAM
ncbi:MAG: glycosyltransferase family 2 protein, partial [Acidimicrobiales bacterium]